MPREDTSFLVNPYNDPVVVKVIGRASFKNSAPMKSFFERLVERGKKRFVIDFKDCSAMDSTFLGILAGLGIQLMKMEPQGSVVLSRMGPRNLELVKNLGLHKILILDDEPPEGTPLNTQNWEDVEENERQSEIESARLVLQAHENLVEADASNETKFQDVISFLKSQVDDK